MRHFNFGDWVRHSEDHTVGLVVITNVDDTGRVRVAWPEGFIYDHDQDELIIIRRANVPV